MASKFKTFSAGEILTASDVNDCLNPNTADHLARAVAAGWASVPLTAGVGTLVIPFPAGRFTASPNVLYSFSTGGNVSGAVIATTAVSTSQCTVKIVHGNTSFAGTLGVSWLAIQA